MALPYCVAYYRAAREDELGRLARKVGAASFLEWLIALNEELGIPPTLEAAGIAPTEIGAIARDAVELYPRPNSPIPLEPERIERLLARPAGAT